MAQEIAEAVARVFMGGATNWSGEVVTERTALTLSAMFRGSMVVAGTTGILPLKTYTTDAQTDERTRVKSFFDNPAGPYDEGTPAATPYEWKETNLLHLVLQGEAPMLHRFNNAGGLIGLEPFHPMALHIERARPEHQSMQGDGKLTYPDGLIYLVAEEGGTRKALSSREITVVPGPISNGLRGMSCLSFGRNSLGIGLAGEKAAGSMFRDGALIAGVLVPGENENLSSEDVDALSDDLDRRLRGTENAGTIPIVNKVLKFEPWQMTNLDAQFLESREFQIEEIARWTGVPPHLLMQLDKQTSWGTGVLQQNKNLAQYVLKPWCTRVEQRGSRLLANPRFIEFDMAGLEAGSAQDEITLLLQQVNGGYLTVNEARRVRNLEPIDGGDVLRVPSGVQLQTQLDAAAAAASVGVPVDPANPQPTEASA